MLTFDFCFSLLHGKLHSQKKSNEKFIFFQIQVQQFWRPSNQFPYDLNKCRLLLSQNFSKNILMTV